MTLSSCLGPVCNHNDIQSDNSTLNKWYLESKVSGIALVLSFPYCSKESWKIFEDKLDMICRENITIFYLSFFHSICCTPFETHAVNSISFNSISILFHLFHLFIDFQPINFILFFIYII